MIKACTGDRSDVPLLSLLSRADGTVGNQGRVDPGERLFLISVRSTSRVPSKPREAVMEDPSSC